MSGRPTGQTLDRLSWMRSQRPLLVLLDVLAVVLGAAPRIGVTGDPT